jgi:cell division protease FtsH
MVEAAHVQAKDILNHYRSDLEKMSEILIKRETIEKEQFEALLAGQTEEEVFGSEAPPPPEVPIPPAPAAERAPGREGPRPLPRPGLAGGTAE